MSPPGRPGPPVDVEEPAIVQGNASLLPLVAIAHPGLQGALASLGGKFAAMAPSGAQPQKPRPGALYWPPSGPALGHIALLHGIMSASSTWWDVAPLLAAEGWEVTALDLPGHGQGPPAGGVAQDLAGLAEAMLPQMPPRTTALVGHSTGALVAAAIGLEYPEITAGVVLVEPPSMEGLDLATFAAGIEAEGEAARQDPAGLRQRLGTDHPSWAPEQVERVVAARTAADTAAIARTLRSGLSWDLPTLIGSLTLPVLVVAAPEGEQSFMYGGSSALMGRERQRLSSFLPSERFHVIGGGHSLQRDQPEKVAELVLSFADELRPRDTLPDPAV